MKTAIVYYSKHHGNTKKLLDAIAASDPSVDLFDVTSTPAEDMTTYQWSDEADINHVREELADVIVYCQNLLDKLGLYVDEIVNAKMAKNEAKYPVEKAKGSAAKYDQLS